MSYLEVVVYYIGQWQEVHMTDINVSQNKIQAVCQILNISACYLCHLKLTKDIPYCTKGYIKWLGVQSLHWPCYSIMWYSE